MCAAFPTTPDPWTRVRCGTRFASSPIPRPRPDSPESSRGTGADHVRPHNPSDNPGVKDPGLRGPNRGQLHGGQKGGGEADVQSNQAAAVRGSGDQNPGDAYKSDRDRTDTPGTEPG